MELRSFNEYVESKALMEKLSAAKRAELLQLRNCRLEDGMWSRIAEGKYRIPQLKLDYTDMRGKIPDLAKCVASFEVEGLSLIWTKLQNTDLRIFKTELEGQRGKIHLNYLCLMHVHFDSIGYEILAQILNLLPDMEELDITNCGLTDDTVRTFHDCISSEKKIAKLRMGRNQKIKDEGMLTVSKLLEKCRIEMIDISRCELTGDHLGSLSENTENIKEVILHGNPSLTSSEILKHLTKWKSLKEMDVSECWLEKEDLDMLRQGPWDACKIIDKRASTNKTSQRMEEKTRKAKLERDRRRDTSAGEITIRNITTTQIYEKFQIRQRSITGPQLGEVMQATLPSLDGSAKETLLKELAGMKVHGPGDLKKLQEDDIISLSLTSDQKIALQSIVQFTKFLPTPSFEERSEAATEPPLSKYN